MSEVLDPPVARPVLGALDALDDALDRLSHIDLWTVGSTELTDTAVRLHTLQCRAEAVTHRLVREVDARGATLALGAPSTAGGRC